MLIKAVSLLTILVAACSQIQAQGCTKDTDCLSSFRCAKQSGCTTGYCTCPSGMNVDTNNCVSPSVKLGATCTTSASCYPAPSTTYTSSTASTTGYCSGGVCTCQSGKPSSDGMSCNFVPIDAACSRKSDCVYNADCVSSKCQCQTGTKKYSDGVNCVPYSPGEACSSTSAQCSLPSYGQTASWGSCTGTGTGTCTCGSGSKSWTYTMYGQSLTICVPTNATVDLSAGSPCTSPSDQGSSSNLKLCGANLMCNTCPGSTSYMCMSMSGSSAVAAALTTIGLAALLTMLLRN